MKKMFLMLAVMLLVSSAYAADVTISCSVDQGTKEVTVNYAAATVADTPRGMGLNIAISTGTITAVTKNTSNGYWVYPGSIDVEGAQYNGEPVAAGGPTFNYMIIEMGALHNPTGPGQGGGPAQSGQVIKFTVDPDGDSDVTISADATRGGVVKYDATEADVTYTGCTVEDEPVGCPTCVGDLDGNNIKNLTDFFQLRGKLNQARSQTGAYSIPKGHSLWDPCGDLNGDDFINLTDFFQLRGQLNQARSQTGSYTLPCP